MPAKKTAPSRPRPSPDKTVSSAPSAPRASKGAAKKMSPKDKQRAALVEKEFGKSVRRAAERAGRKPATWQASERQESRESVLSKIGSAAVQRATTRTWDEWMITLDAEGMRGKTHRDVVHHLATVHRLPAWWCQMVCVGYEQARIQPATQPPTKGFEISVTRTIEASASDVFRAFNDVSRRQWTAGQEYLVRTAVAPRSLRLGLPDGTLVGVAIDRKGNARCSVTLQHSKLPDADAVEKARSAWRDSLARLAGMLAD